MSSHSPAKKATTSARSRCEPSGVLPGRKNASAAAKKEFKKNQQQQKNGRGGCTGCRRIGHVQLGLWGAGTDSQEMVSMTVDTRPSITIPVW